MRKLPMRSADNGISSSAVTTKKVSAEELVRLLLAKPTGLHIEQLEDILWKARNPDAPMPKGFRAVIYTTLSRYSSQSAVFRQKHRTPAQDLFFSPDGKGSGTWAVHRSKAEAWLGTRR
jgi:hypothetical protein